MGGVLKWEGSSYDTEMMEGGEGRERERERKSKTLVTRLPGILGKFSHKPKVKYHRLQRKVQIK